MTNIPPASLTLFTSPLSARHMLFDKFGKKLSAESHALSSFFPHSVCSHFTLLRKLFRNKNRFLFEEKKSEKEKQKRENFWRKKEEEEEEKEERPRKSASMASSKVMASRSPPNPDLPRQSTSTIHHHHQHHSSSAASTSQNQQHQQHQHHNHNHNQLLLHSSNDRSRSFGSMNMEEILKNIYSDSDNFPTTTDVHGGAAVDGGGKGKTVDEVWREIVSGGGGGGANREPEMTLEDFLTKAGAVAEEDVRVPVAVQPVTGVPAAGFGVETMMNSAVPFQPGMPHMQNVPPGGFGVEATPLGFGNGVVAVGRGSGVAGGAIVVSGGGRGKRRAVEDVPLDKATQQKQRRMIKNRESAARSRERKQAYTVELESLVTQLEEENARLLKEEVERNKQRYKQLMENLIPVVEQRRPPRVLRRVNSMSW